MRRRPWSFADQQNYDNYVRLAASTSLTSATNPTERRSRLSHPMWLAAAAVGLLLLFLGRALGHDDAAWIMEGRYVGHNGMLCCGPQDSHRREPDAVRYSPGAFTVTWKGREFAYDEQHVKISIDDHWWACLPADAFLLCLFRPPVGS